MIKLNGKEISFRHYPDGTPLFKFDPSNESVAYVEWLYHSNEEMVFLAFLVRHLQTHGISDISLIMPYIPNARMDRVKKSEDVFTLKYFAEFINSLNFRKVCVLDPHSAVSEALINNVRILPNTLFQRALEQIDTFDDKHETYLFFPDEGAMKRYAAEANRGYTFGVKQRDFSTGKIMSFDVVGDTKFVKDCNVVIIDDICSRGGTVYHSALKLKELGANKIYVCITHCENSIAEGELLKGDLIERIYTTDSTLTLRNAKIEVMPY